MIGIFIGSFNPVTIAHIKICLKLKKSFKKIVLVPVNSREKDLINIKYRIKMLEILKNKYPFLEVNNIMQDYDYLNYSIIDKLKEEYQDISIIIGSDLLDKLDSFENYKYLLDRYSYVVITRENFNALDIIKKKYLDYRNKFTIINFDNNISSTKVRKLLKENGNIKNVLDSDIYDYIVKHHLY